MSDLRHARSSTSVSAVSCLCVVLALLGGRGFAYGDEAETANSHDGLRIDFPADPNLAWDKFGLFIGIDYYAFMPDRCLDGCVNDALANRDMFASRFGVQRYALITNGKATRDGLGDALRALVEQVKIAKTKTNNLITVIITYSGHGSRVDRINPKINEDAQESTWIAADGREVGPDAGKKDIRGSEIRKIHSALSALGAQVIFISDACHSGSGFRGLDKWRGVERKERVSGPANDLFPNLPKAAAGEITPAGFVWYAACADRQVAWEGRDDQNKPCGRLSYTMRKLLPNLQNKVTYGELAARIAAIFNDKYCEQTPEFHAAPGKADERFFSGGFAPPHAEIVRGSIHDDGTLKLTMGQMHGVSTAARFTFYENSDDLEHQRNPLTVATVLSVEPLTCKVQLPSHATVPPTAWAALDAVRMDDFVVGADSTVPQTAIAKLRQLQEKQQIRFAEKAEIPFSVVLHYDAAAQKMGIYSPTALPPSERSAAASQPAAIPQPLRPAMVYRDAADDENLATNLLYVARVRRLMSLEHVGAQLLKSEVVVPQQGGATPDGVKSRDAAGVTQLRNGDNFKIRFVNQSNYQKLFVTIFYVKSDGNVDILYPSSNPSDEHREIKPGATFEFPGPGEQLTAELSEQAKKAGVERTQLKIIAADKDIDFAALLKPPVTGAINVQNPKEHARGGDDELFKLIQDAMHGGGATTTRDISVSRSPSSWATDDIIFDVVAPTPAP